MIERGVRFIELTCPAGNGDRWDQHGNLVDGHTKNAKSVDKPIAALIHDLKQRGLLDETLLVWCGEFGRTPFAQGGDGRDHNPFGFTVWLAGGGVKGGTVYGATDEFGYKAVENKVEVHDLHATMLHLLGVDHTRQTFRFGGRDMRLTDVHGHVVKEIFGQMTVRDCARAACHLFATNSRVRLLPRRNRFTYVCETVTPRRAHLSVKPQARRPSRETVLLSEHCGARS